MRKFQWAVQQIRIMLSSFMGCSVVSPLALVWLVSILLPFPDAFDDFRQVHIIQLVGVGGLVVLQIVELLNEHVGLVPVHSVSVERLIVSHHLGALSLN